MADSASVIRIRADALRSLKETGPQIAAQLGIEPPKLEFFFKDAAYQQAQELTALARWLTTVREALQGLSPALDDAVPTAAISSVVVDAPSPVTERGDNGKHAKTKNS